MLGMLGKLIFPEHMHLEWTFYCVYQLDFQLSFIINNYPTGIEKKSQLEAWEGLLFPVKIKP